MTCFVIGAGIAGLAAALRAAERGADVVLCDEDVEPGGALLHEGAHERARALAQRARRAGVEILTRAPALGYFDGLVPVWQGDTLHQVRAEHFVIATGDDRAAARLPWERRPGVMLAGGARRFGALYAVAAGRRAVVATTNDAGLDAALSLHRLGVEIAAVADLRTDAGEPAARLVAAGIELRTESPVVRAPARRHLLAGVTVARVNGHGEPVAGSHVRLAGARATGAADVSDEQARISELERQPRVAPPAAVARDRRRRGKAFESDEYGPGRSVDRYGFDAVEFSVASATFAGSTWDLTYDGPANSWHTCRATSPRIRTGATRKGSRCSGAESALNSCSKSDFDAATIVDRLRNSGPASRRGGNCTGRRCHHVPGSRSPELRSVPPPERAARWAVLFARHYDWLAKYFGSEEEET